MAPTDLKAEEYSLWNLSLLREYFNPSRSGEEVWLSLDRSQIGSLAPELGEYENLLEAVKDGPEWGTVVRAGRYERGTSADLVQRAKGLEVQRKEYRRRPPMSYIAPGALDPVYRGLKAPTYLPILAVLVCQASTAGEARDERGYYDGLRKALDLPRNWNTPQMVDLEVLWRDLEAWTRSIEGKLGVFTFRQLGGYSRIGVPRSQCILIASDAQRLARVFASLGLTRESDLNNHRLDMILKRVRGNPAQFSNPFVDAAARDEFRDVLKARVTAILRDWDGDLTEPSVAEGQHRPSGTVRVALLPRRGSNGDWMWQVGWAVDVPEQQGSVELVAPDSTFWVGILNGLGRAYIGFSSTDGTSASQALSASSEASQIFSVANVSGDDVSELGFFRLDTAPLRILVLDRGASPPTLVEAPLPRSGPCYFLAAPDNVDNARSFLKREEIDFDLASDAGLPQGWALFQVLRCEGIDEEARADIPDGRTERGYSPVLKRVGGSFVNKRPREYFAYDLPEIELDAPADAKVKTSPPGVLEEVEYEEELSFLGGGARRFRLEEEKLEGVYIVLVEAWLDGQRLGAPLRVAIRREQVFEVLAGDFRLDALGRGGSKLPGLSGILRESEPSDGASTPVETADGPHGDLLDGVSNAMVSAWGQSVGGRFLDRLALSGGSLAAKRSRDLVRDLSRNQGLECSENELLVRLWRRGLAEIEVDRRGRFRRIYAVTPQVFPLGVNESGWEWYGVCGTLTAGLVSNIVGKLHAFLESTGDYELPDLRSLRLRVPSGTDMNGLIEGLGVRVENSTPAHLATWADGRRGALQALYDNAGSSAPNVGAGFDAYRMTTGRFQRSGNEAELFTLGGLPFGLFRFEDELTGSGKIHKLAIKDQDTGQPNFSFAPDRQWAAWIMWTMWGEYSSRELGLELANPWPIPYAENGKLFLPECMRPPVVLERALVLCSGVNPRRASLEVEDFTDDQLMLQERVSPFEELVASRVYKSGNDRLLNPWLVYESVPREVAETVAGKLGARLTSAG